MAQRVKKGRRDKASIELRKIALAHVPEAFKILIDIARKSTSDAVRVTAVKEINHRAAGGTKAEPDMRGTLKQLLGDGDE